MTAETWGSHPINSVSRAMLECTSITHGDSWPACIDHKPFDALLFDLDGTLVDTMSLHARAYGMAFEKFGYQLRVEDYLAHVGPPAQIAISAFAVAAGMGRVDAATIRAIHTEKKKYFSQLLVDTPPQSLNAAKVLMCPEHDKPIGIVSSGNREGVDAILRCMGWHNLLDVVVSGNDTDEGKPAPAPYLKAAAVLGVSPTRCLVFEDTEVGVQAAIAARMSVIDVTRPGAIHFAAGICE